MPLRTRSLTFVVAPNEVLLSLGPKKQRLRSFAAGEKIYFVCSAPSEELIFEPTAKSDVPANRIAPVSAVIDFSTGR